MKKIIYIFCLLFLFININVYADEDLKTVKVNGVAASCVGYECSIEIDSSTATITYEVGENVTSSSPASGHKISDIESEYNVHIELRLADSDTPVSYTLIIRRHQKSADGTLKKLVINEDEIELMENVFVYSYEAKYNDELIKVIGTPNDAKAKAEEEEFPFPLENSSTTFNYFVTAENGTKQKYTLVLKRKNKPDTTLKSITLSDGEIDFQSDLLEYSFSVPDTDNNLAIEAIANSEKATIKVEQKEALEVGENVIKIIVTNEDATDTYVLNVTRLENIDLSIANLKSLSVEDYKLDFKPDKFEYNLEFTEIPSSLQIKAVAKDSNAEVIIENNKDLKDGSVISIKSRISEGVERVYKLKIILKEKEEYVVNKTVVIVLIIVLVVIMIVLFILQLKERKHNNVQKSKKKKVNKKEEVESEIEII